MTGKDSVVLVDKGRMPQIVATSNEKGAATTLATVESQPNKAAERGKALRQVIAAFIANIGTINTGLIFGFSAVVIPQLQAADSLIPVDESQSSWVASLSSIGTPIGCLLSGFVMDNFGRKKALIVTQIPTIIGWIMIASASNVGMIYAGRVLTGFGSGMVGAPARVYTSEVTQPHLRGMLCALATTGISLGVLIQYTLGAFTTWKVLSGISVVVPVLALVLMLFMPETPNYLVSKQKPEKALKSLAKLRGSSVNIEREVDQLKAFAAKTNASGKKKMSFHETVQALVHPSSLKPFAILTFYFMMYQFSGVNTITFYAVDIFRDSGTTMDKYTCTILLGVIRLVFSMFGAILLRRCGRRPLTFISGIGCGCTMVGLGVYLYFKHQWDTSVPPIAPTATWFPVACIFIFIMTCTVGFLIVPWVMIGELYPMKVRGLVGGFTTCMAHSFVFIVVKTYPFLTHVLQRHGTFILYGCFSFAGTVFFYKCLPETKGKTLQEIEDYFSGRLKTLKKPKAGTGGAEGTGDGQQLLLMGNGAKPPVLMAEKNKLLP
ncbi:facilitated trehalose transporter Tret1-2 homolog [Anopheles ziemanni]|uniref:facilitated trehalose transporter Tret1-2 homolog n=1 Tax=Anopheles coustani TaxID=139045 RepID=UPI002658BAB9|nr:facilitated trehalose transporter Tret1-2 homolog [Anopheles coustani]XP_058121180.1 facilitated trehalose transporter Tret1-2 homolog [Anopheles coustani]XP_058121181.1 facilitated trehalose transporter Tret1-2 homolog [Anopheles coustani]XP_058121182.1 facilitated trehalose transporter Tret1-2 homolog [Anopheles coustani]XP_058121183.1 facilitated trehalose transporter Tret1-2 homolog [Anopheles coustani]XP_058121184.1 facilitated trehalose transporter Tret1-2 homolog [Anopheles coustani]